MAYTDIMKNPSVLGLSSDTCRYVCDSAADISSLPTTVAVGSTALCLDSKDVYVLTNAKTWVFFKNAAASGGGGSVDVATLAELGTYLGL